MSRRDPLAVTAVAGWAFVGICTLAGLVAAIALWRVVGNPPLAISLAGLVPVAAVAWSRRGSARAHEASLAADRRRSLLHADTPDAVYVLAPIVRERLIVDFTLEEANARAREVIGSALGELLHRPVPATCHAFGEDEWRAEAREAMATGHEREAEVGVRSAEGPPRLLRRRLVPCGEELVVAVRDVGAEREVARALEKTVERQAQVIAVQQEIAATEKPPHALVDFVLDRCLKATGATGAAFLAVVGDELVYRHARGSAAVQLGHRVARALSLAGTALAEGQLLAADRALGDPRVDRASCERIGARSTAVAPLVFEGKPLGVLQVFAPEEGAFDASDRHALAMVAGALALVLERAATAEAQRVAAAADERLAAIVDASSDAVSEETVDGAVLSWNPGAERLYGYTLDEMAAGGIFQVVLPGGQAEYLKLLQRVSAGESLSCELVRRRKDGTDVEVSLSLSPVGSSRDGLKSVAVVARDVTERRRAERRTLESLHEKELLLKEIHHRVKNNLQVIASLLSLQAGRTKDPETKAALKDSQARVRSIALFHEKIYRADDLAHVGAREYLEALVASLVRTMGRGDVGCRVTGTEKPLSIDSAIPCGLIANELVTNALKHAFPEGRRGTVSVSLTVEAGVWRLVVEDDGVGFQQGPTRQTLGLELVETLAGQLGGRVTMSPPARFEVVFPAA